MNWADWSTSRKILLPASALLLIDSFLTWNQKCVDIGPTHVCGGGGNGWHGIGVIMGILVLLLLAWELIEAFAPDVLRNVNLPAGLIGAAVAAAVLLFTIIRFLEYGDRKIWAWIGLLLAIVIGVGGWLRFSESGGMTSMPARGSMGGGGGTTTTSPPPPPPAAGTPGAPPPGGPPPNEPPPA
jgi:hypothetical protein